MIRALLILVFGLMFNTSVYGEDLSEFVEQNISLLVSIVRQNGDMSVEGLQPKIDGVVGDLINFETVSLGVMGKYRKDASAEQKTAFQQNVRVAIGLLFVKSFRALDPKDIKVVDVKVKGNQGRAKVRFTTSDNTMVELLFNMRKNGDAWLVVNFLVDGVNMGLAYRNVFDARMKEYQDMQEVISRWNTDLNAE